MKKYEIEKMKREHPEGLVMQTGACRYCGQMRQIESLEWWTAEECNEAATELCECEGAVLYTFRKKQKERAEKVIDKQFGMGSPQLLPQAVVDFLKTAAELFKEQRLGKITMTCEDGIKAKISKTSKDSIKVEREKVEKRAEEA